MSTFLKCIAPPLLDPPPLSFFFSPPLFFLSPSFLFLPVKKSRNFYPSPLSPPLIFLSLFPLPPCDFSRNFSPPPQEKSMPQFFFNIKLWECSNHYHYHFNTEEENMSSTQDNPLPLPRDSGGIKRTTYPTDDGPEAKRLEEAFEEAIVCAICQRTPRSAPIFCCSEGHIICELCKENLVVKSCPLCRCKNISNRNLAVEKILEDMEKAGKTFICRNEGCNVKDIPSKLKIHELNCDHRLVTCVAQSWSGCTWVGPFQDLKQHIKDRPCAVTVPMQDLWRVLLSAQMEGPWQTGTWCLEAHLLYRK